MFEPGPRSRHKADELPIEREAEACRGVQRLFAPQQRGGCLHPATPIGRPAAKGVVELLFIPANIQAPLRMWRCSPPANAPILATT